MLTTLLNLGIIFSIIIIIEIYIERKFRVRKTLFNRLGLIKTFVFLFTFLIFIQIVTFLINPKIVENQLYNLLLIIGIVYIIPKRGDSI